MRHQGRRDLGVRFAVLRRFAKWPFGEPSEQARTVLPSSAQQESRCNGCRSEFPFRVLEVDHVIPHRAGGQDNIENLQLLCAHCNRVKGDRPWE